MPRTPLDKKARARRRKQQRIVGVDIDTPRIPRKRPLSREKTQALLAKRLKYCPKCDEVKSITLFSESKTNTTGRASWCKLCYSKYVKNKRRGGDPSIRFRNRAYKKGGYDLTIEQFNEMVLKQEGKCAICGCHPEGRALHVDHDHKTGQVRQILCDKCNKGLGFFNDNAELLLGAVDYLRKHSAKPSTEVQLELFE